MCDRCFQEKNKFERHVSSVVSSSRCPVCSWLLFPKEMVLLRLKRVTKDTLVCDDDAHKADVCTLSHVFYEIKSY